MVWLGGMFGWCYCVVLTPSILSFKAWRPLANEWGSDKILIRIVNAKTLLSATVTFADTASSNPVPAPKFSQTQSGEGSSWFKSYLDSLVKDGAITQAQETTIKIAITIAKEESTDNGDVKSGDNGGFKIVLGSLVKNETITQAQEAAIQSAIIIANEDAVANGDFESVDNGGSKYVLDGLVTDGTITHTQEVAIQSANLNSKRWPYQIIFRNLYRKFHIVSEYRVVLNCVYKRLNGSFGPVKIIQRLNRCDNGQHWAWQKGNKSVAL